ncbi:hypothetical protein VCHA40P242_20257 [Vibrio chagasii]|nr:hypothetical protein VCHA40P242_20257 [Vibrio chagasii]
MATNITGSKSTACYESMMDVTETSNTLNYSRSEPHRFSTKYHVL